jgi:hypothetical protein
MCWNAQCKIDYHLNKATNDNPTMNSPNTNTVDFRMLQKYGLSLDTKKRYFMVYEPQLWTLMGVYDNMDEALDVAGSCREHWNSVCEDARKSDCPYKSKFTQDYVGHNHVFNKGFFQNLTVWDVLENLCDHIVDDSCRISLEDSMNFTLSRISDKLQYYPEKIECTYLRI